MSRKLRQIISTLLLVCALGVLLPGYVMTSFAAGSAKISFSDPTVTVGEEINVTMKYETTDGSGLGDTKILLAYDATLLEFVADDNAFGGAGSINVRTPPAGKKEQSVKLQFKALQAGTAKLTITSADVYNNDGQWIDEVTEGNSTITIKPLATSSADATLQNLQISPGTLTPAFTPQTDTYRVTVGLNTDKFSVDAKTNNDGAKIEINGGTELQEGENTVVCKVTAEDGVTTKDYTITVNKIAGGETEPAEGESETAAPEPEILATINTKAKTLRVIALDEGVEIPEGFKETTIAFGSEDSTVKVTGWVWGADAEARYCVLYGINEKDEKGFYRYDLKEESIQRYFEDPAASTEELEALKAEAAELVSLRHSYRILTYILFAVSGAAALLLIVLIVSAANRKNAVSASHRPRRDEPEEEQLSTYVPVTSGSGSNMSREDRYMIGEEDEYEQYEEVDYDEEMADYADEAAVSLEDEEKALESSLAEAAAAADNSGVDDDDKDFDIFEL